MSTRIDIGGGRVWEKALADGCAAWSATWVEMPAECDGRHVDLEVIATDPSVRALTPAEIERAERGLGPLRAQSVTVRDATGAVVMQDTPQDVTIEWSDIGGTVTVTVDGEQFVPEPGQVTHVLADGRKVRMTWNRSWPATALLCAGVERADAAKLPMPADPTAEPTEAATVGTTYTRAKLAVAVDEAHAALHEKDAWGRVPLPAIEDAHEALHRVGAGMPRVATAREAAALVDIRLTANELDAVIEGVDLHVTNWDALPGERTALAKLRAARGPR